MDNDLDASTMGRVFGMQPRPVPMSAEEEFRWFFLADYQRLVRTIVLITHDRSTAEDVVQEAYLAAAPKVAKGVVVRPSRVMGTTGGHPAGDPRVEAR